MDKLEQYLDQVCRSIGGPRGLRRHVRQELREHLRDAAAEYMATGLSEEAALDKALEVFGGPDEVRSELEATHGHRLLPVVIDKAMQWKENTMRSKWLWTTWAYLAVAGVIVLQVAWISFAVIFLVPKFKKLTYDGVIDAAQLREANAGWMMTFVDKVAEAGGHATWWLLLAVAAVAVFEFGVRSEHKSFIRLSALGMVAVALTAVAALTGGAMIVSFEFAAPPLVKLTAQSAGQHLAQLDTLVQSAEEALGKQNWQAVEQQTSQASAELNQVANYAVGLTGKRSLEDVRAQLGLARRPLHEAQEAAKAKDAGRVEAALQKFRDTYAPLREAGPKKAS